MLVSCVDKRVLANISIPTNVGKNNTAADVLILGVTEQLADTDYVHTK